MATGIIGTSTSSSGAAGATLSYTCPASGVRYAVVSVVASGTATAGATATAGPLSVYSSYTASNSTSEAGSVHYSVVVAPGQTWSAGTTTAGTPSSATLSASVLEVV